MPFADRSDAGRRLGERLTPLATDRPVVVGLARGGVAVGAGVAAALRAPLRVLVARKLGYPPQPELGVGAVSEGGAMVVNDALVARLGMSLQELDEVVRHETAELERRVARYHRGRSAPDVRGRTAVLVDDGLATGFTARAAVESLRRAGARRVVLAVPVAAADAVCALQSVADEVVCLEMPPDLYAIGSWYRDFQQVADEDVEALVAGIEDAASERSDGASHAGPVEIDAGGLELLGELVVPKDASGVVVFAHGSGSSRHSPRNRAVARALQCDGLATVLFDLLSEEEASDRARVFDVARLAGRLVDAARWVGRQPLVAGLPLGLFGASTGAAAAVLSAVELGDEVRALVSRGGRPDLAGARLAEVRCPTLLVVGEHDEVVLALNRRAARALPGEHQLLVIPGATHLFEEPGALEAVADYAGQWFLAAFGAVKVAG